MVELSSKNQWLLEEAQSDLQQTVGSWVSWIDGALGRVDDDRDDEAVASICRTGAERARYGNQFLVAQYLEMKKRAEDATSSFEFDPKNQWLLEEARKDFQQAQKDLEQVVGASISWGMGACSMEGGIHNDKNTSDPAQRNIHGSDGRGPELFAHFSEMKQKMEETVSSLELGVDNGWLTSELDPKNQWLLAEAKRDIQQTKQGIQQVVGTRFSCGEVPELGRIQCESSELDPKYQWLLEEAKKDIHQAKRNIQHSVRTRLTCNDDICTAGGNSPRDGGNAENFRKDVNNAGQISGVPSSEFDIGTHCSMPELGPKNQWLLEEAKNDIRDAVESTLSCADSVCQMQEEIHGTSGDMHQK
eukprot:CAMPEP_0183326730 /NCGR_PEP_ID=MMETSP0160_2-20130417/83000_1 /TAXON_ID=2839 ORGANISM="Odontella Sinensis, Strain Grunow 1884" /NCGR_SAMPLE_ID=MMETSP0160_2 /ASSEMBLY_ACC=CAM_ASM_000250 /LENGTH=358 /DNA_ID=CAMNT_0025494779 /DNA_START=12 /DNA_END=1088 /DNA_ORIENTATION=+